MFHAGVPRDSVYHVCTMGFVGIRGHYWEKVVTIKVTDEDS